MELVHSPRIDGGLAGEIKRRKQATERIKLMGIGAVLSVVALAATIALTSDITPARRGGGGGGDAVGGLSAVQQAALSRIHSAHEQQLALTGLGTNNTASSSGGGGDGNGTNTTCPPVPRRKVYMVSPKFWTWSHTLEVSASDSDDAEGGKMESLGVIKSVPFSYNSEQTWKAADGRVVGRSTQDAITTVSNVFVEDCEHRAVATISEVFSPSNSAVTQYTVQNTEGDIVGLSTFNKGFGTQVEINEQATGKRVVTIFKGFGKDSEAWVAKMRPDQPPTLANDPQVIVMLLAAASSQGSWGLGGPLAVIINPLWLLLLCCCCCACCTAFSRARESRGYNEIPNVGGAFGGQGYATGYGANGYGRTEYV